MTARPWRLEQATGPRWDQWWHRPALVGAFGTLEAAQRKAAALRLRDGTLRIRNADTDEFFPLCDPESTP